jgi:hypothetical protein
MPDAANDNNSECINCAAARCKCRGPRSGPNDGGARNEDEETKVFFELGRHTTAQTAPGLTVRLRQRRDLFDRSGVRTRRSVELRLLGSTMDKGRSFLGRHLQLTGRSERSLRNVPCSRF